MAAYQPTWRDTYTYNPVMCTYNMPVMVPSMQPHFIPTPVVNISLRVASMDGTTLDVTVPERGLVREVKRVVGQVADCDFAFTHDGDFARSPFCLCSCTRSTRT
jgi:hypothetical protein